MRQSKANTHKGGLWGAKRGAEGGKIGRKLKGSGCGWEFRAR